MYRSRTCSMSFGELTAELLNTLIEKILIHEPVKHASGCKDQEIEIFYRFVGK